MRVCTGATLNSRQDQQKEHDLCFTRLRNNPLLTAKFSVREAISQLRQSDLYLISLHLAGKRTDVYPSFQRRDDTLRIALVVNLLFYKVVEVLTKTRFKSYNQLLETARFF